MPGDEGPEDCDEAGPGFGRTAGRSRPGVRRVGAGLVAMPETPSIDPAAAMLTDPEVPEDKRFCWKCRAPVGRADGGDRAATSGTCAHCGSPFNFRPLLAPGDLIADQYEVRGCLAYGGLGWIYLARDRNVSGRWVVLKGLQNPLDFEANVVALAERQFLSEMSHSAIVKIFNFVTHRTVDNIACGYIVMEYIGGRSLRTMLEEREPERLPVSEAIVYVMEVLPALDYLHSDGLAYNDLKPDNIMVTADEVKLIDLGAVAARESGGNLYGTRGYQAPEYTETGPTVASDIYTVARTLAALTLEVPTGADGATLPELRTDDPVLRRYPTFDRLLRRAADPDPDRRFPSTVAMYRQLGGVLRAVLAEDNDCGYPQVSAAFGALRGDFGVVTLLRRTDGIVDGRPRRQGLEISNILAALPVPLVDADCPGVEVLSPLLHGDPGQALQTLRLQRDHPTAEPRSAPTLFDLEETLVAVRARLDLHEVKHARAALDRVRSAHPGDWRIEWYCGVAELGDGDIDRAYEHFDAVHGSVPGEIAPQLALAATAELLAQAESGEAGRRWQSVAAQHYRAVWRVDRGMASAAFGLARCRLMAGDSDGAVATLEQVPEVSRHYNAARLTACLVRVSRRPTDLTETDLRAAHECLLALWDDPRRLQLQVVVLGAALAWLRGGGRPESSAARILDLPCTTSGIRGGLESVLRTAARRAPQRLHRYALIDLANRIRPRSRW